MVTINVPPGAITVQMVPEDVRHQIAEIFRILGEIQAEQIRLDATYAAQVKALEDRLHASTAGLEDAIARNPVKE